MRAGGEPRAREFWQGILGVAEVAKAAELGKRGGCWFKLGGYERVFLEAPFANGIELLTRRVSAA